MTQTSKNIEQETNKDYKLLRRWRQQQQRNCSVDCDICRGRGGNRLVLRVSVSPEIDFSLESFFAYAAGEGFVAAVLPHVCNQVGGLAERLSADCTFVRLLACKVYRRITIT
jgi:hypothetical protein